VAAPRRAKGHAATPARRVWRAERRVIMEVRLSPAWQAPRAAGR
jgi:hypothetical protein